jgi:hypothetical protein
MDSIVIMVDADDTTMEALRDILAQSNEYRKRCLRILERYFDANTNEIPDHHFITVSYLAQGKEPPPPMDEIKKIMLICYPWVLGLTKDKICEGCDSYEACPGENLVPRDWDCLLNHPVLSTGEQLR